MFSRRFRFVSLIVLALAVWLASTAYRNRDQLRVRRLSWENVGGNCMIECEIWNPRSAPVTAKALIRLVSYADEHSALSPAVGLYHEFTYPIAAKSHIQIKESLPRVPAGQPEVRAYVLPTSQQFVSLGATL